MSVTVPPETPETDPLLDEAFAWITRLKSGSATRDDLDQLAAWRAKSAAHDEAFKVAARLFRRAGVAAGNLDTTSDDAPEISPPIPSPAISRRALFGGAIAATAATVAYVAVQPPLGLWPSLGELSADFRTAKGEQRKVALSSDVSLDLNTQTSITLRSADAQTRVELIAGEVVANVRSPLVLLASGGEVRAAHARFDVQSFGNTVCVSCLDGTVDVDHRGKSVRLALAQQVTYSRAQLSAPVSFDPTEVTAWQTGLLIFRNQTLTSVVDEINRYRPGKIVVVSAELRRRLVNGRYQISKLDDFISQVEELFGAKATSLPGGLVILS